ncbi:hypothetical protein SAMN05443637_1032 [Pseudonocardia thermophila]|uniref:Uncharacterized protein n=1 Tax=Pseudonocardia thermophila TaxID=1848 RepID=A0A1M6PZD2_PSETH|nr:proline-rich domain-containing protein [Pseudonocardia thermophila]SHK13355.1 hypothetical protein SAMN05443637_1032 [Pseudonocardia thermophila]
MTEPPQPPPGQWGGQPPGPPQGGGAPYGGPPQGAPPGYGQQQPPPYGNQYGDPQQYGSPQQYGGQQHGYSPYPANGDQSGYGPGHGTPVERPADVETSFKLWIASVIVGLISSVIAFIQMPAMIDAAIAAQPLPTGLSESDLRFGIQIGIVVGIVVGLIFLALYLLFVFKMRAGRNWARIVLTVLGALSVLFTLISFGSVIQQFSAGALGAVSAILTIGQLLLIIAAIVFMWRPAAAAYFSQSRAVR